MKSVAALSLVTGLAACGDGTEPDYHAISGSGAQNAQYTTTLPGHSLSVPLSVFEYSPKDGTLCLIANGVEKSASECFNATGTAGPTQPEKILELSGPNVGVPLNIYKYNPPQARGTQCIIANGVSKASIACSGPS